MKLCRFSIGSCSSPRVGLLSTDSVQDLSAAGITSLAALLESTHLTEVLRALAATPLPVHPLASIQLLAPVDQQEVWAAGGRAVLETMKSRYRDLVLPAL